MKNSSDTIWDRSSEFLICCIAAAAPVTKLYTLKFLALLAAHHILHVSRLRATAVYAAAFDPKFGVGAKFWLHFTHCVNRMLYKNLSHFPFCSTSPAEHMAVIPKCISDCPLTSLQLALTNRTCSEGVKWAPISKPVHCT